MPAAVLFDLGLSGRSAFHFIDVFYPWTPVCTKERAFAVLLRDVREFASGVFRVPIGVLGQVLLFLSGPTVCWGKRYLIYDLGSGRRAYPEVAMAARENGACWDCIGYAGAGLYIEY